MAASNKKSFEFRMSKKVAELTQVVHMLFTRNHEKEVELEALKEAYEHEIELILQDARSKIEEAERRSRDVQLDKRAGDERLKAEVQRATSERDSVWQQKVAELEKQMREEKRESQNSRDLLIKAQQDIQRLRTGQNEDTVRLTRDLNEKSKEIDRFKSLVKNLENSLNDKQQKLSAIGGLEKTHETMRKDLEHCKDTLKISEKAKEQLIARTKALENEIKLIRRELNKKLPLEKPPTTAQSASSSGMMDYGDELERLRREIQRYRNELSNRETNFNRMFADKNPVNLNGDRRGSSPIKSTKLASPSFENGVVMRIARERSSLDSAFHRERTMELARERTFGASYSPTKSIGDREDILENFDVKPRSSERSREPGQPHNRLPSLPASSDATARLQKLMKPKPLPKELLSSKH